VCIIISKVDFKAINWKELPKTIGNNCKALFAAVKNLFKRTGKKAAKAEPEPAEEPAEEAAQEEETTEE